MREMEDTDGYDDDDDDKEEEKGAWGI